MTSIPHLRLEAICKAYGKREVLRGFTGIFETGRIAALIGPNGAGKTTLLRIAAGLQSADSGVVHGGRRLYYGGSDTLPLRGTANHLRRALGLPELDKGSLKLTTLSRGELHRVGLRVALELETDALLLDEPWTALEPDARESLNDEILHMRERKVVVCSSHDLDEVARVADDLVFLGGGVGIWKRREDGVISRDDLLRLYREAKQS